MDTDPLTGAVEIFGNRLYYKSFSSDPRLAESKIPNYTHIVANNSRDSDAKGIPVKRRRIHYFSIDSELIYWNFFLDFGPLNLGQLYKFCQKLNLKLRDPRLANRVICFYSSTEPTKRANAIFLIGAWQVIYLNRSPVEACHAFYNEIIPEYDAESRTPSSPGSNSSEGSLSPIPPFHDASPGVCTYDLTILDCLKGLEKAKMYNFFNFDNFPIDEFEYFEQVENGDLTWIIQNKIIAFAGPNHRRQVTSEGSYALAPSDYIPYFKDRNVGLVIRLNKKCYEENDFIDAGIQHLEQYYLDGSCPTLSILQNVLSAMEAVPSDKAFAVHCKAGLGRTGTCIGAYIMKHYKFTAAEAIGWMRICRPGMVIGPQQHFLQDLERKLWVEGDKMRHSARNYMSGDENKLGIESLYLKEHKGSSEAELGISGQAEALLSRRKQSPN